MSLADLLYETMPDFIRHTLEEQAIDPQDYAKRWAVAIGDHPEDAPRITMTKSYLSGRQCCDFTIAEDDSEMHEEGCPWRIVDEFAKAVYKHGCPVLGCSLPWIESHIAKLEMDMASSPIRRVEDAPGGPEGNRLREIGLCPECVGKVSNEIVELMLDAALETLHDLLEARRDALNRLKGDET
jgi:hypothetical protein